MTTDARRGASWKRIEADGGELGVVGLFATHQVIADARRERSLGKAPPQLNPGVRPPADASVRQPA